MYVLRQSLDIHADLARNWSAWMGTWSQSAVECATLYCEDQRHEDESDEAFAMRLADAGIIREHAGAWAVYHHDGLSAYALDAEDEAAAIAEARALAARIGVASGDGVAAYGHLAVVAELGGGWYVLSADECWANV